MSRYNITLHSFIKVCYINDWSSFISPASNWLLYISKLFQLCFLVHCLWRSLGPFIVTICTKITKKTKTIIIPFSCLFRPGPRYTVKYVNSDVTSVDRRTTEPTTEPPSETKPFYSRLLLNDRVTAPDHWQDVRLLKFDISGSNIKWVFVKSKFCMMMMMMMMVMITAVVIIIINSCNVHCVYFKDCIWFLLF